MPGLEFEKGVLFYIGPILIGLVSIYGLLKGAAKAGFVPFGTFLGPEKGWFNQRKNFGRFS